MQRGAAHWGPDWAAALQNSTLERELESLLVISHLCYIQMATLGFIKCYKLIFK